jgi:hypothetical protein
MHLPRGLVALASICVTFILVAPAEASDRVDWHWRELLQPCKGDCAFMIFAGRAVGTNVQDIFFKPIGPTAWQYDNGGFVGATASRKIVTFFNSFTLEAEIGAGQRFGNMHETEFWEALYGRYHNFPWNKFIHTTVAVSTGLSYATGVSDFEKTHSGLNPPSGTHVMHYFSPEVTLALPEHLDRQLVFRLHHRSGAYGIVSGAFSGATYMTVGLRLWF